MQLLYVMFKKNVKEKYEESDSYIFFGGGLAGMSKAFSFLGQEKSLFFNRNLNLFFFTKCF